MKAMAVGLLLFGAAAFMRPIEGLCQSVDWKGQLSAWFTTNNSQALGIQLGIRYIPVFSLKTTLGGTSAFDAEASLNVFGAAQFHRLDSVQTSSDIKPYRLWVRFSTPQLEARLGLQKINFGSALLLRPLMWFDRIDPNDPLQLTDGVYGLLLKYTFLNNTNIWLWGLYGNNDTKGWEAVPSLRKYAEYGGRAQVPFLAGELALSYHHRRMNTQASLIPLPAEEKQAVPENRIGLDGKWDIGAGVWFEAVLAHQDFAIYPLKYQRYLNFGLDYTFGLGNGLHVLTEYLAVDSSEKAFTSEESIRFSAVALDYPLGLLDRIKGMVFYNWKTKDWYRFITWQRTYDRWSFYLIAFWNPEEYRIYASQQGKNLFGGKGIQIMAVFNH
jgi:hypothetical protein